MRNVWPLVLCLSLSLPLSGCAGDDEPSCTGTATACTFLLPLECDDALGCILVGCAGVATSCSLISWRSDCDDQEGCWWSSLDDECEGTVLPCNLMSGQMECTDQQGCTWDTTCSGTPFECDAISTEAVCEMQPGCSWE